MPSPGRKADENAKYCSLFFRPWTLLTGTEEVPHLEHLGMKFADLQRLYAVPPPAKRLRVKVPAVEELHLAVSAGHQWTAAWDEYIRGNVVSETAAEYIKFPSSSLVIGCHVTDSQETFESATSYGRHNLANGGTDARCSLKCKSKHCQIPR